MLNVESRRAAYFIWFVISLIFLTAAWSAFKIPSPPILWDGALKSELAATFERFQMLLGLLFGFSILAGAIIVNGKRNRLSRSNLREDERQNMLNALSAELADLSANCHTKAKEAWAFSEQLENNDMMGNAGERQQLVLPEELFRAIASPLDTVLMDATPQDLSSLGHNSYQHLRRLRQELRYVEDMIDEAPIDEDCTAGEQAQFFQALAQSYSALSRACLHAKEICDGKSDVDQLHDCCGQHAQVETAHTVAIEDLRLRAH